MKRRYDTVDKSLLGGVLVALVGLALVMKPHRSSLKAPALEAVVVGDARFKLDLRDGKILVGDAHGTSEVEIEANLVVDGTLRPLAGPFSGTELARVVEVNAGGVKAKVLIRLERGLLRARIQDPETLAPHRVELRFAIVPTAPVWVPGAGHISSNDAVLANAAIVEQGAHPFVIAAPFGARIALEPAALKDDPEDAAAALDPDASTPLAPSPTEDASTEEPSASDHGKGRLVVTTEIIPAAKSVDEIGDASIAPDARAKPFDAGRSRSDASSDAALTTDASLAPPERRESVAPPERRESVAPPERRESDAGVDAGDDDGEDAPPEEDDLDEPRDAQVAEGGPRLEATPTVPSRRKPRPELVVFLGNSPEGTYGQVFRTLGHRVAKVAGRVTGATSGVSLFGIDDTGHPRVHAALGPDATFSVEAPADVDHWYALEGTSASTPIRFPPGTGWPLVLDLSPGGELHVRVVDVDTKEKIPARVWVHGIDGTLDPSFGPDFRASGAGPLMDVLAGEVITPLPKGRYRIEATHGLEWSIDARTIEVVSAKRATMDLTLRHVVDTPNLVGCDLHVHARPSFDSQVSVEDRIVTLVTAGVEFAVPTEHNIVGDYGPSLVALGIDKSFGTTSGVEVTTFGPRYGHFGVFPYPVDQKVPPYRQARAGQMFEAARKGDPSRIIQVNHPRLPKGIGYFNITGFDSKTGVVPLRMRTDFDTVEVYNGYEIQNPAQVEAVLRDWYALLARGRKYAATGSSDSHTVQYNWAGYPRTLVRQDDEKAGTPGHPAVAKTIVAAIKAGRSIVTSGPVVDLVVEGGKPGDDVALAVGRDTAVAHVKVSAAPWVDVTEVELVVDGKSFIKKPVRQQPTAVGVEAGTLAEARARAVRFEEDIRVPLGPGPHFVVAVARGSRKMDDVLPFMPFLPMGFTNPVWVTRPSQNPP